MTTYRYDRVARRRPQFLARTEWLKPDWPVVPDAKVAIVPGRSSGVRFSVIIRALKQYVELQRQYPQPPQPPQPYGNNQQPAAALPSIWPTLLITFFFGIFGIIPAVMHTTRAREAGRPTNNYWATPTSSTATSRLPTATSSRTGQLRHCDGSYTCTRRTH